MRLWWAAATVAVTFGHAAGRFARRARLPIAFADGVCSSWLSAGRRAAAQRRAVSEAGRPGGASQGTAAPAPEKRIDELLRRVQGEFLEMPGLRLTARQAQRLWGLRSSTCDVLLTTLLEKRFLTRTRDGAFVLQSSR